MAKMYTLDDKLLVGTPELRIGDKLYPIDNRVKTVKKIMKMYEDDKNNNVDGMDKVVELAYGKNSKAIINMDMSWEAYQELLSLTMKALTGEEQEEEKEERFPEIKSSK